ncbi:MAG TPA: hypothetical protein VM783_17870 [Candidatus Acidoferrum sp.]|nr:hypothetical protein [Candidatus Acidoferrum sp.]
MSDATNVPTNGFVAPAPAPAPQVPQHQGGFHVPSQGGATVTPPNGNVTSSPNMQPGWVQNPGQQVQPQQQAPQAQQQQAAPDMSSVITLLQAALAGQPAQATQAPATPQATLNVGGYDVAQIDDPIIKAMATVMTTTAKGMDLDRAIGKAVSFGDASLIDVHYIREAGGQNAEQLTEIAKGIVASVNAKAQAVTADVHSLVGGEANWNASVAAFNQAAPHELRVIVGEMLDSHDTNRIKAGAKLVAEFGKSSGHIPQQGASLLNTVSAGSQGQGLSKAQFKQELAKLNKNDEAAYAEAREALIARRTLGARAGLQ